QRYCGTTLYLVPVTSPVTPCHRSTSLTPSRALRLGDRPLLGPGRRRRRARPRSVLLSVRAGARRLRAPLVGADVDRGADRRRSAHARRAAAPRPARPRRRSGALRDPHGRTALRRDPRPGAIPDRAVRRVPLPAP